MANTIALRKQYSTLLDGYEYAGYPECLSRFCKAELYDAG